MNKYLKYSLFISAGTFIGLQTAKYIKKKKQAIPTLHNPKTENTTVTPLVSDLEEKRKNIESSINSVIENKDLKKEKTRDNSEQEVYHKGFLIQKGIRGGKYYINEKGKKIYLKQ